MPFAYKVLGQSAPTSTANANAYTVPSATQAIISSIIVANTTATSTTFRIFQRIAGATAAASNAIAYDVSISGNSMVVIEAKNTLNATDIITVQSATANALTFTVNGTEIT